MSSPPTTRTPKPRRKPRIAARRVSRAPLPRTFELRDPPAVKSYLSKHPTLRPVLGELAKALAHHFSGLDVALQVLDDPETDSGSMLFALVNAGKSPVAQARQKLRKFDETWTNENESRLHDALCVSLEFR